MQNTHVDRGSSGLGALTWDHLSNMIDAVYGYGCREDTLRGILQRRYGPLRVLQNIEQVVTYAYKESNGSRGVRAKCTLDGEDPRKVYRSRKFVKGSRGWKVWQQERKAWKEAVGIRQAMRSGRVRRMQQIEQQIICRQMDMMKALQLGRVSLFKERMWRCGGEGQAADIRTMMIGAGHNNDPLPWLSHMNKLQDVVRRRKALLDEKTPIPSVEDVVRMMKGLRQVYDEPDTKRRRRRVRWSSISSNSTTHVRGPLRKCLYVPLGGVVELEGIDLGCFELVWDIEEGKRTIIALDPVYERKDSCYYHPHVNEWGQPCMGDQIDAWARAGDRYDLMSTADLAYGAAHSYNEGFAYREMADWDGEEEYGSTEEVECHSCGYWMREDDAGVCVECGEYVCPGCSDICSVCGDTYCTHSGRDNGMDNMVTTRSVGYICWSCIEGMNRAMGIRAEAAEEAPVEALDILFDELVGQEPVNND